MHKIRLLDEDTINKIAAGEVIERPASVVKELVENSIDAGAARILIEVIDGGKSLVKVTDDGCGIDPDDLPLAFQKHATSKIRGAGDLENIRTLGFRGEALASIASVSRQVAVYTKTREAISGTNIRLEEGKIAEIREAGCPAGTSISVHDLFHNVPARRKHLKGAEAELVHIINTITEMAIINYGVSFELFTGRRTLFKSVRSATWDDVLLRLFGLKTFRAMTPLQAEGRGWRLTGIAGDALTTRSGPDRIFIFVNGRAVVSRALAGALRESYRNIIPAGRSPVAVISLQIGPDLVDVNVHPAKREIRLLREEEIADALCRAVSLALQAQPQAHAQMHEPMDVQLHAQELPGGVLEDVNLKEAGPQAWPGQRSALAASLSGAEILHQSAQRCLPLELGEDLMPPVAVAEVPAVRILGQILDLYIVAEGRDGLMLIDQHAAAERIRFERLQDLYSRKKIRQELAEPVALELSPGEQVLLQSWQGTLQEIGFEIEPFGGNTFSVRAVPALGRRLESPESVHDILRDLFSSGRVASDSTSRDEILRLLACRGSIKSGKTLSIVEMHRLLEELRACRNPLTCPHGRPVTAVIDRGQLERLFARR